ncbi:MAG: NUDIX hydrolase [Candidatus Hodarchaeales archaeon]
MKKWITESSREVYSHPHLSIVEDNIRILPDEIVGERFITIKGKDVALILPIKEHSGDQFFGLVHQYRYSWGTMSWEIPAGLREENEDIKITAQRELEEETGLRCSPDNLLALMSFRSNAISQAVYYVFEVKTFEEGLSHPEDTEDLYFAWKRREEVSDMLRDGVISHGPTYTGLLWYFQFSKGTE